MAASYVTLILDETDAEGNPVTQGSAAIVPSQRLPDPADDMLVGQAPVTEQLGPAASVRLVSNDSIGPQQGSGMPGWTYTITYHWVPGAPQPWSFYLLSTNGATQRLSEIAQSPAAQPGQMYVPLPPGSAPGAGDVLTVVSTNPMVTAWASGTGIDGGSPSSVYTAAQVISGGSP